MSLVATTAPSQTHHERRLGWAYSAALFLSAFLLFQVQLILAKYFLPWFGGTPAMWTTCMFFFQSLLVVGYLYAHIVADRVSVRLQGWLHSVVLACALVVSFFLALRWHSPLFPGSGWKPVGPENPVYRLLVLLFLSAGIPYFSLSTTGPLLQSWFVQTHPGRSPYRLYSLSNLGSFLALLSYPVAVEPWFTLKEQARIWFCLYALFILFCGYCGLQLRRVSTLRSPNRRVSAAEPGRAPGFKLCVFWLSLAASGSLLFLATTNQICQNIAVVPLLWVLPLSIYLLSLVICFDKPHYYRREFFYPALVVGLPLAVFLLSEGALTRLLLQIVCYALILFAGCMVCHGELVRSKPPAQHLTLFYLMVSLGGAVAGVLVVLIAPRMFTGFWEYQVALCLTALLMLIASIRDTNSWVYMNRFGVLLIALTAAALPGAITLIMHGRIGLNYVFLLLLVMLAALAVSRKSVAGFSKAKAQAAVLFTTFAVLLLCGIFALSAGLQGQGSIFRVRNFYGVLTVKALNSGQPQWEAYGLSHGIISHGFQFRSSPKSQLATSYFAARSGVGRAIAALRGATTQEHSQKLRFGIIGLGVGTLAAYARAGDYVRFYEINPDVIHIASSSAYFTYLSSCPAALEIVPGDARLSMERELARGSPQKFDLLAVDAFSGDAPPVHLLTRQAFQIYANEVAPDGIIAVNVTNTYVDLRPVVAGIANDLRLNYAFVHDDGDGRIALYSDWMLLSRTPLPLSDVGPLTETKSRKLVWTDDYSNLFQVLR